MKLHTKDKYQCLKSNGAFIDAVMMAYECKWIGYNPDMIFENC